MKESEDAAKITYSLNVDGSSVKFAKDTSATDAT